MLGIAARNTRPGPGPRCRRRAGWFHWNHSTRTWTSAPTTCWVLRPATPSQNLDLGAVGELGGSTGNTGPGPDRRRRRHAGCCGPQHSVRTWTSAPTASWVLRPATPSQNLDLGAVGELGGSTGNTGPGPDRRRRQRVGCFGPKHSGRNWTLAPRSTWAEPHRDESKQLRFSVGMWL